MRNRLVRKHAIAYITEEACSSDINCLMRLVTVFIKVKGSDLMQKNILLLTENTLYLVCLINYKT